MTDCHVDIEMETVNEHERLVHNNSDTDSSDEEQEDPNNVIIGMCSLICFMLLR